MKSRGREKRFLLFSEILLRLLWNGEKYTLNNKAGQSERIRHRWGQKTVVFIKFLVFPYSPIQTNGKRLEGFIFLVFSSSIENKYYFPFGPDIHKTTR